MAAAAVELAERYRFKGRVYTTIARWLPAIMFVLFSAITIPPASEGDVEMAILFGLFCLAGTLNLIFNPALRPKNVTRSLEASRRVLTSGD